MLHSTLACNASLRGEFRPAILGDEGVRAGRNESFDFSDLLYSHYAIAKLIGCTFAKFTFCFACQRL